MVTGALGAPGEAALKHVELEQEKELGAVTIPLQSMGGDTALDQAARQELATLQLVQVNVNTNLQKFTDRGTQRVNPRGTGQL